MTDDTKLDAEMRLLYQDSLDIIRDLKRQQWSVRGVEAGAEGS